MIITTEAIILHSRKYSDTSKILVAFTRDEGKGDEDRRHHQTGHIEDHLDAPSIQRRPEPAMSAVKQHIDQARFKTGRQFVGQGGCAGGGWRST